MLFARMLAAFRLRDDPGYIVRDGKHLQLGAMPIGLAAQLFHNLRQALIVARNLKAALIEAQLLQTGRRRPIRSLIGFVQRFGSPRFSSSENCPLWLKQNRSKLVSIRSFA